ncbi:MAG: PAS domain S-box protein [Pedobacter sp.]|nr:MAG: PAS domain S-box protein [Pedobacter sp.]
MATLKHVNKYIVAIGASAGGLEAIHEFFDHMPASSSFSFVVIQHLSSDYKSLLVELVAKHTHMKVFEAANDMLIQQDCVYIIPNNKLMTVSKGKLKLADKSLVKAPNTAIDTFLHTLAEDSKEKAIAIILSGTGTDGTKGIQSVKECGGMVIVQDPSTAKFDGMPNSAIASGNADYIVSPDKMHKELFNYVNEEPVKVLTDGKIDEVLLDEIFKLVHNNSGNDFNLYKTPTIIRRIGRRMNEHNLKKLGDYVAFLRDDEAEVKILGQDFLIGVTKFFRDKAAYEVLTNKILPDIISNKAEGEAIKIWVCACSTGQEAYTVAILVNECVKESGKNLEVKIFATDIDEKSIEIASRNQYPESIANEIPAKLFKKYFVKEGRSYGLIPEIRKQVVFAKHDVIKSPPFIKNDMVTCRNMLIYVNSILQEKILSTFHFSLNKTGYLFLGSSETASSLREGLTEVSSKWKIYQKTGVINYSNYNTYNTGSRRYKDQEGNKSAVSDAPNTAVEKNFNKFITDDLGYVGVFIDKAYMIQEAIGNYRQFLSLPEQKIELNVLKMVPREISIVLSTSIRKAWKENKKVHLRRIRLKRGGSEVYLNISVQPPDYHSGMSYTMIVFGESLTEFNHEKEDVVMSTLTDDQQNEYVFELEAELNETRSNLQMAVEEMETTNEELQSSNEELLSANEELQSSNEELQSLNEELHTLNTEHQVKIKELVELNDDLDNYFRSTDIGQVFLDSGLFIRKFNPAAISMVNLIDADIGRSIEHISNNIKADNFTADIRSVLHTGHLIEKEIQLKNGNRSLMRIMPYVRRDKKTDGVVITFVDISLITELNNIITGVFNASLSAVLAFKAIRNQDHFITDFKCISFNEMAAKFLKKTTDDLTNAMMVKQLPELTTGTLFTKYVNVVEKGAILQTDFQIGDHEWYQLVAVKMSDGFAATITNVTDQKAADKKLKKNYNELITVRENLKALNSDLESQVDERTRSLSESEERFKLVSQATNDTIWDWSLVNNTMWRSDNFTSMFGYDQNSDNINISFWFDKVHEDDRKRIKDSVYQAINNKSAQWSEEYRLLKADGVYAVILDRGSILINDLGTPYRMVGSMIDITEQKEVEKRRNALQEMVKKQQDEFYSIFKQAPAIISIRRGEDLRYSFVNDSFLEFNGPGNYIGKTSLEINPQLEGSEMLKIEQEVIKTGRTFVSKEFLIKRLDPITGKLKDFWFDFIFTPVFGDDDMVDGIAFFGFDVSDLVSAQKATKELMQKKDEFMSIASHELKTPITSIKGFLQIALKLAHRQSDTTVLGYLDKANRQVGKLTSLVDDLLDVTKIQAGKMQFNFDTFNIRELITECVDDIKGDTGYRFVTGDVVSYEIQGDRHRIEQVISNFLSNAIKYAPESKEILIKAALTDDNQLKVSVRDFGIGIPQDKAEYVFDRFFRVEESSMMFSGLGLGLYISSEIIKRHGGTIGVDSKEHEGSEFWFKIPV